MRKLGITVLVIVVLLIAAGLIIPHVIDINHYRGQIQAELQKRLGRTVQLGDMSFSLIPPAFEVQNAVIGSDPQFSNDNRPFAAADKLKIRVAFWPLLSKKLDVKSLELDRPKIELVRNQQGVWNFSTLGQPAQPASTPAPSKQGPPTSAEKAQPSPPPTPQSAQSGQATQNSGAASQLSLANLSIVDGQVAITDQQKRQPRAVYNHIDVTLNNFAPDRPFFIQAAAHLPSDGKGSQNSGAKETIRLQGKGGPIQQADILNTPFDGTLALDQVSLASAQKFVNSQALSGINALATGQAAVKNANSKITSSGNIELQNPQIRSVNVGYPITINYDATDDLNNDVIEIRKGDIRLGQTPLTVTGTMDLRPTPSQADLKLTTKNASIEEAARLASAFGVAFGQGTNVKGTINADIAAKGALNKPAMNGHLDATNLVLTTKEVPQPVKVPAIDLALTPQTIKSNDFSATTGSTTVNVNFALNQYTSPKSTVDATVRAPNANIAELLNIAHAAGVSAVQGMTGSGVLTLNVHAQGPTKNLSALALSGTGKLQNASLKLPSLTQPIGVRNADMAFNRNSATLNNLAASVGQTNATGQLTMKNFAAPQVQFTLKADKVDVNQLQQLMGTAPAQPKRAALEHSFWHIVPEAQAEAGPVSSPQPSLLNKITGGGNVSIGTVTYNDLVLTNVHTRVTLDRGLIHLNPLSANLYNGTESGSATIDMRPAQPVYTLALNTNKVDANELISSVSDLKQTLYGLLNSNVNATFSSTSANAIARSLNGKLGINLTNGKLMNVDLLHELASVGKFLGAPGVPSAAQSFTNLLQLSGNFNVKNGVAQTNNLKAVIAGGTMAAAGLVNLADQSLNLHVTAVLDKALSQKVGGNQIGGFMNTALANNQGELVIPVIVTGTFQHPSVAPDLQQIAQMKLKNLLPTSKNPGALTSGILGQILGKKGATQNGNAQQPQGGLSGILGAIGKQTQQQQQQQPNGAVTGNQGQQPQAQPTPTPNPLDSILGRVLGGKKKAQPTPTPK
ncbi:MAG TPA: AsmA family protein [Candidatus Angelobacter sp.]|nr:AsmA family protein [Candidatus Angelobacter sp.]